MKNVDIVFPVLHGLYGEKYIYIDKNFNEEVCSLDRVCDIVEEKLGYPVFIKPSNSGSSVGINKSHNREELMEHIAYAAKFDCKILIEENIDGREVECAVLGNEEVKASCVGEILPAEDFYTFDAKYKNAESRVDFFIDKKTGDILINEINTLPGFTQISMYPKLWEQMGVSYTELLDRLIDLA